MWSYASSTGNGYTGNTDFQNSPSYGNNYTDPNSYSNSPSYGNDYSGSGNSWLQNNSNSLIGAGLNGVSSYANAQQAADIAAEKSKLSLQAQLDQAKQQRTYQVQNRQFKSDAESSWGKYFA